MTFEEIQHRAIYLNSGKPIFFREGERKVKAMVWTLERYFRLKTEGVVIGDRWYMCYAPDFTPPPLNRDQLAAIEFAARHFNETTLGFWRDQCIHLPYWAGAPIDEEDRDRQTWTFTDKTRAEMCLAICRDEFGLDVHLESYQGEWMVAIRGSATGSKSMGLADYYRMQGAVRVLFRHTIARANVAVKKGCAARFANVSMGKPTAPPSPPEKPAKVAPKRRPLVRTRAMAAG